MHDLSHIKNFLLDLDGTLYLGDRRLDGTPELLDRIAARGGRALFLTNNSSRDRREYLDKLRRLGIPAQPGDIYSSADAATYTLEQRSPSRRIPIYLLGTPALERHFADAGFVLTGRGEQPQYVVLGFDTTLTYEKIWTACDYIRGGVPFVATHPDLTCPVEGGFMPDTGSMCAMIAAATGVSPEYMGKPTANMAGAIFDTFRLDRAQTCMVGDRLATDIAFGANAGIVSVLVYSGETTPEMYAAQQQITADYTFPSVRQLAEAL